MKLIKKLSIVVFSITIALVISTAVLTYSYTSAAQTAELVSNTGIVNGGFEIDLLADPNAPTHPNPNITGWTKSGDPKSTALSVISNYPHTGKQGLSLGAFRNISYISQKISTVPEKYYQLTFYLAADGVKIPDNAFKVFAGGKILADLKNIPHQQYKQYQYTFEADKSLTKIKFGSVNKNAFFYLDDVSVQPKT